MFTSAPWISNAPAADSAGADRSPNTSRSRSPPAGRAGPADRDQSERVTGIPMADTWFEQNVYEDQIKTQFMELPLWRRKNVILKCMENPPNNPASWLLACIRNYRTQELERRLTGSASVHHRPLPSPLMQGPPLQHVVDGCMQHGAAGGGRPDAGVGLPVAVGAQPAWTQPLLDCWPQRKGQMVGLLVAQLDTETQAEVYKQSPQTMASLAFCLAVAGNSSQTASEQVRAWLQRVASPPVVPPSPRAVAPKPQVQVIFSGHDRVVAFVLAMTFAHIYEKIHQDSVAMLPFIIVGLGQGGPDGVDEAKSSKLEINKSVRTPACVAAFLDTNAVAFKENGVRTVFISVLSATSLSAQGCDSAASCGEAVLHRGAFKDVWTPLRWSETMRGAGDGKVADLLFCPADLPPQVSDLVEKLVGPKQSVQKAIYNGVATVPGVYCTPGDITVVKCLQDHDSCTVKDEWSLVVKSSEVCARSGLLGHIQRLMEIRVFEERPLTEQEAKLLESFTIVHSNTGERRIASRAWFLKWWGLCKSPFERLCDESYPCAGTIYSVTGLPAPASCPGAKPCGQDRFCQQCEAMFQTLDRVYNLPTMADSAVSFVYRAVQAWSSPDERGAMWNRSGDVNRSHECGPGCSYAR